MKKLFSKPLIVFLPLCFNMVIDNNPISAQTQPDIVSMNVMLKQHFDPANPLDTLDPKQDVIYTLVLNDTVNVKKIHLQTGTADGGNDIFTLSVKFDDKNLPQGISYKRTGSVAVITLASQPIYADYYYEAKIENISGNFSTPHKYHFQ